MTEQQTQTILQDSQQLAGKHLSFRLADQEYALQILKVREIIGMQDITIVPKTPKHVKGVINLRGKVIPVIDLRLKLHLPEAQYTEATAIIITQTADGQVGILVDAVSEVLEIPAEDIEEAPSFGSQVDTSFVLGLAKTQGRVTILLDLTRIITANDLSATGFSPDNSSQKEA